MGLKVVDRTHLEPAVRAETSVKQAIITTKYRYIRTNALTNKIQ